MKYYYAIGDKVLRTSEPAEDFERSVDEKSYNWLCFEDHVEVNAL